MNLDDLILYHIQISGLSNIDMSIVSQKIGLSSLQRISPATTIDGEPQRDGSITILRLNTRWRGDSAEQAWQDGLRASLGDLGTLLIDVRPWEYAPGYPKGEVEL